MKPLCVFRAGKRLWSREDDALLRALYPDVRTADIATRMGRTVCAVYGRANLLDLNKSEAFRASPASGRTNGRQGIGTRFAKGHASHNKGLRRPGWFRGRMKETQFKKGERGGVAVRLWKPIGTERVSKDGYLERKVNNGMLLQRRWRAVHLIVWEAANGPLPKGHAVSFVNGDRTDTRIENLSLVSRADLMRRNTVHNLPKPLAEAVQLIGAVRRQINRRSREKQNRRSA